MSMIQNLIKKAFGTVNVNEAASFLASACNRMKNSSRAEILHEIEQALTGVNLQRVPGQDPTMAARLKAAEAEVVHLRAELASVRQKVPPQTEVQRLSARLHLLQKSLDGEREHHYRELALLRETMQRQLDDLHCTMQRDTKSQRELREELVKNGDALVDAVQACQTYINVLKTDLSEARALAEGYNSEIRAQIQINLTLQSSLDELLKTTQNQAFAKESAPGERQQSIGSKNFTRWIAEK
ncbi:hypothetical protein [Dryocola sp. LX212]